MWEREGDRKEEVRVAKESDRKNMEDIGDEGKRR